MEATKIENEIADLENQIRLQRELFRQAHSAKMGRWHYAREWGGKSNYHNEPEYKEHARKELEAGNEFSRLVNLRKQLPNYDEFQRSGGANFRAKASKTQYLFQHGIVESGAHTTVFHA